MTDTFDAGTVPLAHRKHPMPHGAEWRPGEGTRFRLWAPAHDTVDLVLESDGAEHLHPMQRQDDGWKEVLVSAADPGTRYRFLLPDGTKVPDPASRCQPDDVHGASLVVDPEAFGWRDGGWRGRSWHEAVLYEMHIGAFTPEGTFLAAIEKLDHLAALGVTAIEIMPVSDFPGQRGWGYDGVLPYAPERSYGRPEDFKRLIETAHARRISVLLDVVYNHLGPDGNYLSAYAPGFFTDRHTTPWGAAINYDGHHSRAVRDFAIDNALYWLEEFHLDGLRLDAVHAIIDDSPVDLLRELVERVRMTITDRPVHLLLENEDNVASRLARTELDGATARYTAQWNDDVHHVLHVSATGEKQGYYQDYWGDTDKLGRALAQGFAFQGEVMPYRERERGEPSTGLPPGAFVAFIQNHDQIGNRAFGERIHAVAPAMAARAIAAVYLLLPQVPMLFMGEEWAASTPFPFFCDFDGALAEAVRKGRREEFARFPEFHDPATRERIPDPQAQTTFRSAKLKWDEIDTMPHRDSLAWYGQVLATRREIVLPLLAGIGAHAGSYDVIGDAAVTVRWRIEGGGALVLDANLKAEAQDGFGNPGGRAVWLAGNAADGVLGPWSVRWTVAQDATASAAGPRA